MTEAGTPCGSVPIDPHPTYPVLADGVFVHTTAFTKPQTIEVTLPAGVTCDKCTLQVIEFMGDHPLNVPGGCFYHHCADLSIQPPSDAPVGPAPDGSGGSDGMVVVAEAERRREGRRARERRRGRLRRASPRESGDAELGVRPRRLPRRAPRRGGPPRSARSRSCSVAGGEGPRSTSVRKLPPPSRPASPSALRGQGTLC